MVGEQDGQLDHHALLAFGKISQGLSPANGFPSAKTLSNAVLVRSRDPKAHFFAEKPCIFSDEFPSREEFSMPILGLDEKFVHVLQILLKFMI
jgi:hypothetical protein